MGKIRTNMTFAKEKDLFLKKQIARMIIKEAVENDYKEREGFVYTKDKDGFFYHKPKECIGDHETIVTRKEYLDGIIPPEWRIDNEE